MTAADPISSPVHYFAGRIGNNGAQTPNLGSMRPNLDRLPYYVLIALVLAFLLIRYAASQP